MGGSGDPVNEAFRGVGMGQHGTLFESEARFQRGDAPCFFTSVEYNPKSITGTKSARTTSIRISVRFSEAAIANEEEEREEESAVACVRVCSAWGREVGYWRRSHVPSSVRRGCPPSTEARWERKTSFFFFGFFASVLFYSQTKKHGKKNPSDGMEFF